MRLYKHLFMKRNFGVREKEKKKYNGGRGGEVNKELTNKKKVGRVKKGKEREQRKRE